MMQQYEWRGDRGEISGHVVFASGSRGQIVELDSAVADEAIAGGFPLRPVAVTAVQIDPVNPVEDEVKDHGSI